MKSVFDGSTPLIEPLNYDDWTDPETACKPFYTVESMVVETVRSFDEKPRANGPSAANSPNNTNLGPKDFFKNGMIWVKCKLGELL